MDVRDVYLLFTLLGFREISKDEYEKKLRKGYEHSTCKCVMYDDASVTWSIRVCYPRIFHHNVVVDEFNRHYTMFTGIIVK